MEKIDLSIVIPCYNEGDKLRNNIERLLEFLRNRSDIKSYEILIVNDGSKDNTHLISRCLSFEYEHVRDVGYETNKGKGGAVKKGISKSVGEWVIFMDADLSTDLIAINEFWKKKDSFDVVIGSRRHKDTKLVKKQKLLRRFIGKSCSILTNIIIPLNISDTQCGFKAFKGDIIREFIKLQKLNGFAFDVEYLYMAKLNDFKIGEIGVYWENDEDSRVPVLNSSIKFFKDLFKIRNNKKIYKL